tara:strand:+ start:160 stop:1194 length:1035 start_codon:yes stop_codon:yes gene_type:complete
MTYIIGEIGQNHNGSADIAKLIIDLVSLDVKDDVFDRKYAGMNAVKLTKRNLSEELSSSKMNMPYNSIHSFGKTYGCHRKYLELSNEQHYEIYKHAKKKGLDFVETLCSIKCLSILKLFEPDKLKVASRDLTNLPLLNELAKTKIPIIISTGMAGKKELDDSLNVITKYHDKISILHCVSEYPTKPDNVNLNTISYLKKNYKKFKVGYSDHTVGIAAAVAAVALGAEIIEKHITIDRRMKGTDQAGSLGPNGVIRMVRDIRLISKSLGKEEIFKLSSIRETMEKLERSIASKNDIKKNQMIKEEDLHMLSPGDGYKWIEKDDIIGKKMKRDFKKNEIIYKKDIY